MGVYNGGKRSRLSGGKEHDRSGAGKEGYAEICAGCEGSERNGMRPLRSPCGCRNMWRRIGLLRECYIGECTGICSVGILWKIWIQ